MVKLACITLSSEPGGPDAVVLREATRRAGVAPNAAYRHFASLRAVGTGYLRFAQAQKGLFRTAFAASDKLLQGTAELSTAGPGGLNPFELLGAALDRLVQTGVLPPERRPGAEFLAWSAVHGLAMLVIDGPLASVVGPRMQQVGQRLLEMVEKGL